MKFITYFTVHALPCGWYTVIDNTLLPVMSVDGEVYLTDAWATATAYARFLTAQCRTFAYPTSHPEE